MNRTSCSTTRAEVLSGGSLFAGAHVRLNTRYHICTLHFGYTTFQGFALLTSYYTILSRGKFNAQSCVSITTKKRPAHQPESSPDSSTFVPNSRMRRGKSETATRREKKCDYLVEFFMIQVAKYRTSYR